MGYLNVEIKARTNKDDKIRAYLLEHGADFKGVDHQIDTYFNVPDGRLKLREGNIENNLIYYERVNQTGPKSSNFNLIKIADAAGLKEVLKKALGIKIIVQKKREIYYIGNVKFHLDEVPDLGKFVEIEAGNILSDLEEKELQGQCEYYTKEFEIEPNDLISVSYSDMMSRESIVGSL